jgi:8-oxo-dGTP pyrophosphatase MutT (NUDIX family)
LINKLKAELLKTLPGQAIQFQMAPFGRTPNFDSAELSTYKSSAVMILFCLDEKGNWFLPLTQRFSYAGAHSGQISLPGGKFDAADLSLQDTALRECYEEIGISENVEVLGSLTKLYIPVSSYMVMPFIGCCSVNEPSFVPQAREVKNILRLYLNDLLDDSLVKRGAVEVEGTNRFSIEAPYFRLGEHKIWGATAMMLNELKTILKSSTF